MSTAIEHRTSLTKHAARTHALYAPKCSCGWVGQMANGDEARAQASAHLAEVVVPIPASDFQASYEVREANRSRLSSGHVDECFFCGRGLTEKAVAGGWAVHLRTDGFLLPVSWGFDDVESQGCFPVGSECAKKVPATHRARFSA